MSISFFNQVFTFWQPDGTAFRVRGTGDESSAIFETLDGYTVVKNPISGFYEYSVPSEDGKDISPSGVQVNAVQPNLMNLQKGIRPATELSRLSPATSSGLPSSPMRWEIRRRQRRDALQSAMDSNILPAPPQREIVGEFVGLLLLIQFPDVSGTITQQEVEQFCNGQGYTGFDNNGSVFDVFNDNSRGKLRITHVVAPYYTAKNNRDYYTNSEIPYGIRTRELIKEALGFHIDNKFDFSGISVDDEGLIFATSVFYAGIRVNNWAEGLWPHAHHLATAVDLAPGRAAYDYQITDMTDELSLGTFCHELGHLLCDFPDLYDKTPFKSSGIGNYCLMCAGNHANQKNPIQVCGYLKYAAGWIDEIKDIEAGITTELSAEKNEFVIVRKNGSEYFLIENRARSGRDEALPDEGLAVWHIDELGDNSDEDMKPDKHFECSLLQADGKNHLEKGQNQGDNGALFHAGYKDEISDITIPNSKWWDGTNSGLHITEVGAAGPMISFFVPSHDDKEAEVDLG